MKRPPFRLERVLRVRRILEQEARAAWNERERRALEAEGSAARGADARDVALGRLGAELADLSPAQALWRHARLDGMTRDAVALRERARTLRHQADLAFAPFERRREERRALERLRERDRRRVAEIARREEAAEQDEITIQRAARLRRARPKK